MVYRIEVFSTIPDMRAHVRLKRLHAENFSIDSLEIVDVYTLDSAITLEEASQVAQILSNPVTQKSIVRTSENPEDKKERLYVDFDSAIEIGFLPGVKDNVASTAREIIQDFLKKEFSIGEDVYTSKVFYLKGKLSNEQIIKLVDSLYNPLIQRASVKSVKDEILFTVPKVKLTLKPSVDTINILEMSDEQLTILGKQGVPNPDGTTRGPLALNVPYMKTIQAHCKEIGRNITDIELEFIAQSWSEHCKHPKFADPIDDVMEGLFKKYIKASTEEIRKAKKSEDFCVSVFTDNSGAIIFDEDFLITDKCETHNSPSALDPFGGAITGIVGVNRDTIGFGLGAKPIINCYGYCFAEPNDTEPLYKGKNFTQKMLTPRRIMEGVIEGVNVGGNCSGIPTPQGFVLFDKRYKGKPLVFVRTLGLIPIETSGRKNYEKKANAGDYIVMIGGRVGKDGIHGATFSSEALDSGSPATAVQIGDPITQKKFSDAIVKEARDLELYSSITDNGAGGLSSSVGEMAKESGGFHVYLDSVPLKYPGLAPWEIWISESQERMSVAVPKHKWKDFFELMEMRGVEATIIGEFTDTGKCVVEYDGKYVIDIDMGFVHEGLPKIHIQTQSKIELHEEPNFEMPNDLTHSMHSMLARNNIGSFSFISQQYDHEVQGGSVLKPLQGRGRVNADATAVRPVLNSQKTAVISHGLNPSYSDISTYHMAACAIDTAIRNSIAAGADINHLALMDNFCWCSADDPVRMGQLKDAVIACYDYSIAYETPFISGKDSMYNDFRGFDNEGMPIKISIPPTLLVSTLGVVDDARKLVSLDAKLPGDLVYILGETYEELGGSEYYAMVGETQKDSHQKGKGYVGNVVPKVDAKKNKKLYQALTKAIHAGLVASSQSVHRGGLAVALAKTAIGGMLGMDIELSAVPGNVKRADNILYSESSGRIVVTVSPENSSTFEKIMEGNSYARIGVITDDSSFRIIGRDGKDVIKTDVKKLYDSYTSTFGGY